MNADTPNSCNRRTFAKYCVAAGCGVFSLLIGNGCTTPSPKTANGEKTSSDFLIRKTYREMTVARDSNELLPGANYLISDRNIILKATSSNALSLYGDYTKNVRAVAWFDLVGKGGTVESIKAEGMELLPEPIKYDGSVQSMAWNLALAIRKNHKDDYLAISADGRVYIYAPGEHGEKANGRRVNIRTAGDVKVNNLNHFQHGKNTINELWYQVRYDFDNDSLTYLADKLENTYTHPFGSQVFKGFCVMDYDARNAEEVGANQMFIGLLLFTNPNAICTTNVIRRGAILNLKNSAVICRLNDLQEETQINIDDIINERVAVAENRLSGNGSQLNIRSVVADNVGVYDNYLNYAVINIEKLAFGFEQNEVGFDIDNVHHFNPDPSREHKGLKVSSSHSNYENNLMLLDGSIDFNEDKYKHWTGVVTVQIPYANSGELNIIKGLEYAPTTFEIKVAEGQSLHLKEGRNIKLGGKMFKVELNGTRGDVLYFKKYGSGVRQIAMVQ